MSLKVFLISLLITNNAYANDPVALREGEPAPFSGLLFSPKKANELRANLIEKEYWQKMAESYQTTVTGFENILKIKDDNNKLLLERNDQISKTLRDQKDFNTWERVGWFGLGVLATVLAGFAVREVVR